MGLHDLHVLILSLWLRFIRVGASAWHMGCSETLAWTNRQVLAVQSSPRAQEEEP